jgi:hypothetical protein
MPECNDWFDILAKVLLAEGLGVIEDQEWGGFDPAGKRSELLERGGWSACMEVSPAKRGGDRFDQMLRRYFRGVHNER